MKKMDGNMKLLTCGVSGSVIAALCCFTPLLVVLFGFVGVSAWLGWIDFVLFPALAFFLAITAYALYRRSQRPATQAKQDVEEANLSSKEIQP